MIQKKYNDYAKVIFLEEDEFVEIYESGELLVTFLKAWKIVVTKCRIKVYSMQNPSYHYKEWFDKRYYEYHVDRYVKLQGK